MYSHFSILRFTTTFNHARFYKYCASASARRVVFFWHMLGNKFLTLLSNMTTNLNLTYMESCYKICRREVLDQVSVEENRFCVEPKFIAKVAKPNVRIYEVGISCYGPTYDEGKKNGWRDGVRAFYVILKYGLFR